MSVSGLAGWAKTAPTRRRQGTTYDPPLPTLLEAEWADSAGQ
jgi:hypothetical protein